MEPIRVLLADPHALVRAGVRSLVEQRPGFEIAGEARTGRQVLSLVERRTPDVLLIEPLITDPAGPEIARRIEARAAGPPVLALTRCRMAWMARLMLEHGACGYLLKKESPALLFEALRGAPRGEDGFLSSKIVSKLYSRRRLGLLEAERRLMRQEWIVMKLVVDGLSNSEIAERLFIQTGTAKNHVSHLLGKLGMPSRLKLMAWAHRQGIAHLPPPYKGRFLAIGIKKASHVIRRKRRYTGRATKPNFRKITMARSDQLNDWTHAVQENLPHLSKPQAVVLAAWSFAAVLAQSATLTSVTSFLAALGGQKPNTVRQRLKEWYKDKPDKKGPKRRQIDPAVCFGPLLGWVLRLWEGKRMALALDATNLGDRYVALAVSVVFRGSAIPVAWRILPADRKGAWKPCWLALLDRLAEALPEEKRASMTIIALTDRGLYAEWLFRKIQQVGWHPFMRISRNGMFRPDGNEAECWMSSGEIVPQPGRRFHMSGTMFKTKKCRLRCTLLACWEVGYEGPWLVVTDLPPAACEVEWYGLRAWIEQGFKCLKSSGLQWQKTRLGAYERVERLWLVYAVASLWMLSVGSEIEQGRPQAACPSATVLAELASPPGTGKRRQVRLFRIGLVAVLVNLLRAERLPLPKRLLPLAWPRGPTPPEQTECCDSA